jgi:hypothetical protein
VSLRFHALACDYDRTLTDAQGAPQPEALAALDRARGRGLKVVVVSGRPLGLLQKAVPMADAIVAENGCVQWRPGALWRAPWKERARALAALGRAGVRAEHAPFEVLVSLDRERGAEALRILGPLAYGMALIPNVDRVMLLPRGVDKGAGLLAALEGLGIPPERCAAVGDAENDVPMLQVAGLGAAVANAVPELRAVADVQLAHPRGRGVAELVERLLHEP